MWVILSWEPLLQDPYIEYGSTFWTPRTKCELGTASQLDVQFLSPGVYLTAYVPSLSYCWALVKNYAQTILTPFNRHKFTVTSKTLFSEHGLGYCSQGVGGFIYPKTPLVAKLHGGGLKDINRIEVYFPVHYRFHTAIYPAPTPEVEWHWRLCWQDRLLLYYFVANQPVGETVTVNVESDTFKDLLNQIRPGLDTNINIPFLTEEIDELLSVDLEDATFYFPYLHVDAVDAGYIEAAFYHCQYYYKKGIVWKTAVSPVKLIQVS